MQLYSLGSIDPLLVDKFGGFDRPRSGSLVTLLSDGGDGPHQVLQSSAVPASTATISGHLVTEADKDTLRGYELSKEEIDFTDANGNTTRVVVWEVTVDDEAYFWTFGATLLALGA